MIAIDRIPIEIRKSPRAVVWKREMRDGKETKVPYVPARPWERAAVDNPATWGPFNQALAAVASGKADGPGIVLGDGLVGVDLDNCRDPRSGTVAPSTLAIVRALDSYTEVSPSGSGLHVLTRGTLPPGGRRKAGVEMYTTGRYFTVTGQHLPGTPTRIAERTAALAAVHAQIFGTNESGRHDAPRRMVRTVDDDARLLEQARAARNGAKFAALWQGDWSGYPSQSEADQALCNLLAFWTRGDAARVDRLFRQSGLWRPKWDARRGEQTYGERTITAAIAGCAERAS